MSTRRKKIPETMQKSNTLSTAVLALSALPAIGVTCEQFTAGKPV